MPIAHNHHPEPERAARRPRALSGGLAAGLTAGPAPATAARRADVAPAEAAERVMAVLPRVMDAMRQAMRAQLDGPLTVPLTVPQFRGLNFVDLHPGSSLSALAGFLGVTLGTASAMVERLVRAGYLLSQGSAQDRRRAELQIQPAGKQVLEQMRQRTAAQLALSLAGRSGAELQALIDGLGVLDAAFAEVGPAA